MKQINRLKVVLVEQNKTGKWLAETLEKNEATVSRFSSFCHLHSPVPAACRVPGHF